MISKILLPVSNFIAFPILPQIRNFQKRRFIPINLLPAILLIFLHSKCESNLFHVEDKVITTPCVCGCDWLNNPIYHSQNKENEPVKNDPESFTASINGKIWRASQKIRIIYYKGSLTVMGENDSHRLHFRISDVNKKDAHVDFNIWLKNMENYHYSVNPSEVQFQIINLNTVKNTVTAKFRASIHLEAEHYRGTYAISNGRLDQVKFSRLYCKKNYTLKDIKTDFRGRWKLIEIADCGSNTIHHPPCTSDPYVDFAPEDSARYSGVGKYKDKFKVYGTANVMESSFKFLNDSTIVTSGAAQTLVGSSGYKMDYEKLYFSYLSNDTFRIRMAYNLLELVNSDGDRIRFHYIEN